MKIELRKTTTSDLDFVLAAESHPENCNYVYQWSYDEHMASLSDNNLRHYVVESNNELLGYVILDQANDASQSINLRRLVITKKNSGIGKQVLEQIKLIAFTELSANRLWLDVFTDNLIAYNLYKKCGFREEGKLIDSYLRKDGYASQYIMAILKREYTACQN